MFCLRVMLEDHHDPERKGYVLRSRSRSGAKKRTMGEEVWEGGEGIDRQAVWSRWEPGPFATIALVSKKKKIQVQFGYRRSREKNPLPTPHCRSDGEIRMTTSPLTNRKGFDLFSLCRPRRRPNKKTSHVSCGGFAC